MIQSRIPDGAMRVTAVTPDGAALDPSFKQRARAWLEGGVRTIQLRDKILAPEQLEPLGRFLRAIASEYRALLIVNDYPQLAVQLGADGCHLGQEDMAPAEARKILGEDRILGLSTHNKRDVAAARDLPIDYIGVGPIFRSSSKDAGRPMLGPVFAGWAAREAGVPVVAIGGITLANAGQLAQAGCGNAAVIAALAQAPKPAEAARTLLEIMNAANPAPAR